MIRSIIKGGLPVEVSGRKAPAEPDVGIPRAYIEDLEVAFLSGHEVPGELNDEDRERLEQELLDYIDEPPEREREP